MPVNLKKLQQTALSLGGTKSEWFSIRDYNIPHEIRILCPPDKDEPWVRHVFHNGPMKGSWEVGDRLRKISCLDIHGNGSEACPVCAVNQWAYANKIDKVKAGTRKDQQFYMNVVDMTDDKVKIYGAKKSVIEDLLGFFNDPDWGDFTHPVTGHNTVVQRTGSKEDWQNVEHKAQLKPKPTKVSVKDWETQLHDLDAVIRVTPYAEILQIMAKNLKNVPFEDIFGFDIEVKEEEETEDADEEDDVEVTRTRKKAQSKASSGRPAKKAGAKVKAGSRVTAKSTRRSR